MTPSSTSFRVPQCRNPERHAIILGSLKHTLIAFGFGVDEAEGFKNNIFTEAFLEPWSTYRDEYLLNPEYKGEGLNAAVNTVDEMFDSIDETVNGPPRRMVSCLREEASDRGYTVRLFTSLVDSLTDLGGYYDDLAKEYGRSLMMMCEQLRRLIVHLKVEYNHGHGVFIDAIEVRRPSPWIKKEQLPTKQGEEEKKTEVGVEETETPDTAQSDISKEDDISEGFVQSNVENGDEIDGVDVHFLQHLDKSEDEAEEQDAELAAPTPTSNQPTPSPKSKPKNFDDLLVRGARAAKNKFSSGLVSLAQKTLTTQTPRTITTEDTHDNVTPISTPINSPHETLVIPAHTVDSRHKTHPEFAAMKKMFGADTRPLLPVTKFETAERTAKAAKAKKETEARNRITKTAMSVAVTSPATPAATPVTVIKAKEATAITQQKQDKDKNEEKTYEHLLMLEMFGRNLDTLLPTPAPIIIDDAKNDNPDSSPPLYLPTSTNLPSDIPLPARNKTIQTPAVGSRHNCQAHIHPRPPTKKQKAGYMPRAAKEEYTAAAQEMRRTFRPDDGKRIVGGECGSSADEAKVLEDGWGGVDGREDKLGTRGNEAKEGKRGLKRARSESVVL